MERELNACDFGGRRCAGKHSEDFHYCELSSQKIRLLEIQKPGHKSPRPHFRLRHYYRNETPPYIALSYTWGDEDNPIEEIFINSRKKRVRPNLFQALYFLRGYHQFQYLWVDALCIDQDDVEERNEQVRNMHFTFRDAKLVVAWLGCLNLDHPAIKGQDDSKNMQAAIWHLAHRKYWSRMWVIQEILLAQDINILCDQYLITWSAFCKDLRTYAATHCDAYTRTCALEFDLARHQVGSKSLISLLHTYGRSVCREFKDKIFALLSLLPYRERLTLDKYFPNYKLSNDEIRMITLRHIRSQSSEYDVLTLMNDKILQEALRIKSSIIWDRLVFGWNLDDDPDIECYDDNHLDCGSGTSDYHFDSEVDSVEDIADLKTRKVKRNLKRSEPATDRFNEDKSDLPEDSHFGLLDKFKSPKRKLKQVKGFQAQAIKYWS